MSDQRIIDIGVEGNDGTGDSIRESFRKTNENFRDIYAVFGQGGRIEFTSLSDTPDERAPNTIPLVNSDGTFIDLVELGSNSDLDEDASDTIVFDYSVDGKLIISSFFTKVEEDEEPRLGGPLNALGRAIANVGLDGDAVEEYNNKYGAEINVDNLVITKGFADQRYISPEVPVRVEGEPATTDRYIITIDNYINGNLLVPGHGFTRLINGTPFVFRARFDVPEVLEDDETYFLRVVNDDQLSLFENREDAEVISDGDARDLQLIISGTIDPDDPHTLIDAAFDSELPGNFLRDVVMPRENIVRRQGDTMTGALDLHDHPGDLEGFGIVNGNDDLQAATKFYVDNSAYSSPENLFVSTFGDNSMTGVPAGREGTALPYAFRTIGAAARRAAEIIQTSPAEPGPYFQTITTNDGDFEATVVQADIVSPQNEQTRKLIDINIDFLVKEALGFIDFEYPVFEYDREIFEESYREILLSQAFDINRGRTANFLVRKSAENFFNSIDGRIAISRQLEENLAGIEFLKESVNSVLQNQFYQQKLVERIDVEEDRARVVTVTNHNYRDGNQIFFKDMGGMTEIENLSAYVRVIDDTTLELYLDQDLENIWDISSFTDYTTGGRIGLVYQDRVKDFDSIKITQTFDEPDAAEENRLAILDKFDLIENILENGIDAGSDVIFGNNYKIVLDNKNQTFVDQANPNNTDTLPGKIIVGKLSGAQGRIVSLVNNDPTEENNDSFELQQLTAADFRTGEPVEYGNFVKKRQISILIESGIYEEDLPIKLSNNVSIKGDEFRRVIVRPKRRISQSIWADTYFYRDQEFDGIAVLEKQHSKVSQVGGDTSTKLQVDDISWMTGNLPVNFIGNSLIGSELEKRTEYYIVNIDESTLEIEVSETENGSPISFATASGEMYVIASSVAGFVNQTNDVQGYFGRHYLRDAYAGKNIGIIPENAGNYTRAADILELNRAYIQQELIAYITEQTNTANSANDTDSVWFQFQYNEAQYIDNFGITVDSIVKDLRRGGTEFSQENQGFYDLVTDESETDQTDLVLAQIGTIASSLFNAVVSPQSGDIRPDISLGEAEEGAIPLVGGLVDLVRFAFSENYNPPRRNDADGMDVFQASDATIVRNVTVQGHGGFMLVLDPVEQILTKSPYIQTGSSFSKSDNKKRFRGGMYVDAFVGNIPARITNVTSPFELDIESDEGQGLRIRPPQLPCPFYLDGIRYQVNAISSYDSGQGTATIFLDANTNPDSLGDGQGYLGSADQEIFLQTAGNRSMLGNDFTQINDLGYNGSEIRSLNGSNGYGFFGLVAEGADPNEIPDAVTLRDPMVQPGKAFTTTETPNVIEDPFIHVYDLEKPPTLDCVVTIDHGPTLGVLNYRISQIENFSDSNNDGQLGNSPDDIVATNGVVSNAVYRLNIIPDSAITDDFFGDLQADVPNDTLVEIRNTKSQIFDGVRDSESLEVRPSTAINYEESFEITYRSLAFNGADSLEQDLPDDQILTIVEADYDFVRLEVDLDALSVGFGLTKGDTKIPVRPLPTEERIEKLLRDVEGRQPGDNNYSGGMIFSYAGKTHQVMAYEDDSSVPYIVIDDKNTDIAQSGVTGLAAGIPNTYERIFFAGLFAGSKAEITTAISLLRATGHDFTQIGTGSYNDSNYPNVILGEPENDEAGSYTDSPTATKSQVWERRKGRVFFVSTDQDGFFRVGKFFSVDQGTGDIEFAGELGLTGANALGFRRGVTINEFSADDSFSDNSSQAAPTERATGGYINRVLGYNVRSTSQIERPEVGGNRIGPGFLPLNGDSPLEGNVDMGQNQITNLALPGSDGSAAANKNYVDAIIQSYDSLVDIRNIEANNIQGNDLIVATGKMKVVVEPISGGTWEIGDLIGVDGGNKEGTVVDIETRVDEIEGDIQIVTYTLETETDFAIGDTIKDQPGETGSTTVIDGPFDEIANASENSSSVINVTIDRQQSEVTYNLQIKDNSVVNADINSSAGIVQSKLNMQSADIFDEDDATSGWNGTASKSQSDLGLATFSDENFEIDSGYVRIKEGGIAFPEIQDIPEQTVLGRSNSGTGNLTSISFADIVNEGSGLADNDFTNNIDREDENFPGDVLVKLDTGAYGVTPISEDVGSNTIARRRDNGYLDAQGYRIGGFDFATLSSTELRLQTPGGAQILTAIGSTTESLVTRFPGAIDIGDTSLSSQSNFQAGSGLSNEGWLAVDWIYSSFIEAPGERDSDSTGIGIGANTGFANAGNSVLDFITNGSEKLVIDATTISVLDDLVIGSDADDSVTFTARIGSNILPDVTSSRNIGANGSRFNTVYADVFNGVATEAKYADLAENYQADADYDAGTVVIFGGDQEITVTDRKGDRRIAGIVSENPAYLMNSDLQEKNTVPIALQGRVQCKVLGKVEKGDLIVSSAIPGYAVVDNDPRVGAVIGKALQDKTTDGKDTVEVVVGRV